MRRVRYYQYGGPEVLTVEDVDPPAPQAGQVLLRVEAVGVNFVDTRFRRGPGSGSIFERPLPGRPTGDVVGTITRVGPGGDARLIGRRVAALAEDAYADYAVAEAQWLAPVPENLGAGDASMLAMSAPVALRVLRSAPLRPGDTVLIHAAAGGVGHLAVQLAKLLGAGTVIGTARSARRLDFVRSVGADVAIDYSEPDWPDRVRAAAPGGVDVVLDAVGGPVLQASLDLLAPFGRAVVYGAATGKLEHVPVVSLFALRSVTGFNLTAWRRANPDEARREMDELTDLFAAGRLRATVHAGLPLTEAATAHQLIESRSHTGRVLLLPGGLGPGAA
ncbi:NADPH:quinone reductase-like Zn-dependent oxidoreductase [Actinoplanes octamycinicus]|uniref:NADPH:quinone reductase-like Zn-dependent oxidoreductase n=1 Tax=Actinoplanes octamycinicus TaxID=135948 RepID=A0A7W7H0Z2_9ACTN|nr:zinc-binding dehydrogenase [Actinoplanes octamycinicus]MBB4741980.1 NADPH:quinone reductase-like Zn-dependent oxidoreductase [Actinoplanes octamycinicus]GIE60743.1 oxidoreductase [Actinoplanes octamycinicus]